MYCKDIHVLLPYIVKLDCLSILLEHKYPTEEMKEQLAHDIGLTEKQISGWFCHRRLKDKRLGLLNKEGCKNGRQDRSSGVIQDSCGSTKQGDYKLAEVESRRLCSQDFPLDPPYEYRGHYTGKFSGRDDDVDTSSDSSSPLQDRNFPQMQDPHEMAMATVVPSVKRGHGGPSGYLKVKGEVEHAAITAVKRNLGRNYHVDGPPVGIEFQPLPPGAFETPVIDNVNGKWGASICLFVLIMLVFNQLDMISAISCQIN